MAAGAVAYSAADDDIIHLVPLDDDDDDDDEGGYSEGRVKFRAIPCTRLSLVVITAVSLVFLVGMVIIGVIAWHIRHGTSESAQVIAQYTTVKVDTTTALPTGVTSAGVLTDTSSTTAALVTVSTTTEEPAADIYSGNQTIFSLGDGPYPSYYQDHYTAVNYRKLIANIGGSITHGAGASLHNTSAVFRAPGHDLFLISIVTMVPISGVMTMILEGAGSGVGLLHRSGTNKNLESVSRSVLLSVPAEAEVRLMYEGYISCCSSNSWSGFAVSAYMRPLVAFSAAMGATDPDEPQPIGLVRYDRTLLNTGSFHGGTTFVAPRAGVYYFTASGGLQAAQGVSFRLMRNDTPAAEFIHNSTLHTGVIQAQGTCLLQLTAGDMVRVQLTQGSFYSSLEFSDTSFAGFLYSPANVTEPVVWQLTTNTTTKAQYQDHLSFPVVSINIGLSNLTDTTIVIPQSGAYYIHVTITTPPNRSSQVAIQTTTSSDGQNTTHDEQYDYAWLQHDSVDMNGYHVLSGGFIFNLQAGDQVWVMGVSHNGVIEYTGGNLNTAFMGFLIADA